MVHFNWTQLIPGVGHELVHVATGLVVSGMLISIAIVGRLALGNGEKAVVPANKVSIKGFMELITEFIVYLANLVMGKAGMKFVPMFAALFTFIFINNLMGLIPGMTPATDNMNTTFAVGLFSFVTYNLWGLKENEIITNYLLNK